MTSAGAGTVTHLAGEMFKHLANTPDILHVLYRGAGPGLVDLMANVVPMMTPNVTGQVLNFHRSGDIRILAVCAPARLKRSQKFQRLSKRSQEWSPNSPAAFWRRREPHNRSSLKFPKLPRP
jgi:tripartite-type tricarboxylate transporter receptor subunit TctC